MIDKNGYHRGKVNHSDLVHRQIAYEHIYKKHREKFPLPFSKYVVHHKDGKKTNNDISNLEILTPKEHDGEHGIEPKGTSYYEPEKSKIRIGMPLFFLILGLLLTYWIWDDGILPRYFIGFNYFFGTFLFIEFILLIFFFAFKQRFMK